VSVSTAADAVISDHPEAQRYEVQVGDALAGYAQYRARPGLIAFTHTEIRDRFEGQGMASRLIAFALDDARKRGLDVLPFCPFVNAYVQRHREYVELVPEAYRQSFDL
jgi:predicted GNAT family acetyltransferase